MARGGGVPRSPRRVASPDPGPPGLGRAGGGAGPAGCGTIRRAGSGSGGPVATGGAGNDRERSAMTLARPWMLLLLLAIPLWLWFRRRHQVAVAISDVAIPGQAATTSWWPRIPPALRAATLVLWAVAAAGPQFGSGEMLLRGEGIAIVLAIDVSSSMLAEDFAPSNRLEVAKRQATAFVRGRQADRIGLVTFAGEALTQVPLTLDYRMLEQSIGNLRVGGLEDGTAIGTGLTTALNRLRRIPNRSKVVLLLTDGENNRGAVDPRTAARAAQTLGVRVYTIGVGT